MSCPLNLSVKSVQLDLKLDKSAAKVNQLENLSHSENKQKGSFAIYLYLQKKKTLTLNFLVKMLELELKAKRWLSSPSANKKV